MRRFGGCNFQLSTMPQRNYVAVAILIGIALGGMAHAQAPVRITLEQAIDLAISHNHALKAAKLQIQQGQAQEVTASLRPNPTLTWDALFLPIEPQNFNTNTLLNTTEFDLGLGYLFERGGKRR